VGLAVTHETRGNSDGRIALAPDGVSDGFIHGYDFGCVYDLNVEAVRPRVGVPLLREFSSDTILMSNKDYACAQIARRLNRTRDLDCRGLVAAHCVNGDSGEHSRSREIEL
jgi:hypothetical protein